MTTWATFLADEVSERLARQRWMATAMSASLHGALILAAAVALPWHPEAGSEWGADVTFELALKADDTLRSAPVAAVVLPEPTPVDPPSSADFLPPAPAPAIATPMQMPAIETPPQLQAASPALETLPVEKRLEEMLPHVEAPPQPQQASAVPEALPAQTRLEEMMPPAEAPPNVSARDFARAKPAPPPPPAGRRQHAQAAPVPPPPAKRPVQEARRPSAGQPAPARDTAAQRQFEEDYFLQIVRKISRYRFHSTVQQNVERGMVVTRMTIARDGRLLDVALMKSSGYPNLDWAVVETIRQASPFAPLPAELGQDRKTFIVPVNYSRDR